MMKKNKLWVVFALVVLMCLTTGAVVFAGGAEEAVTADEVPVVTIMTPFDPGRPTGSDLWVFKAWGEDAGVEFDVISPPRDVYAEKMVATLASGVLPDAMNFFRDAQTYITYGPQLFVALDEYLDAGKMPNLQKWLEKYPEIRAEMNHPDNGNLYGLPLVQDFNNVPNGWFMRNDLLNQEGMDVDDIKTLDDVKRALTLLQKANGGGYIAGARLGFNYFSWISGAPFGLDGGDDKSGGVILDVRDPEGTGRYIMSLLEPEYKIYVEFFSWMYEEEMLHPNFLTMQRPELDAGWESGEFVFQMSQTGMISSMNKQNLPEREVKMLSQFEVDGKIFNLKVDRHNNIGYRYPWVISNKSEYIDELVHAFDLTYSSSNGYLTLIGAEGEHWVVDPAYPVGYKVIGIQHSHTRDMVAKGEMTQDEYDALPTSADLGTCWWIAGVIPETQRLGLSGKLPGEDPEIVFMVKNAWDQHMDGGYVIGPDPKILFNKEENDTRAEIVTPLGTYIAENVSMFIIGERPMSEWDDFLDGLENFDYQELLDMWNEKLDELN